MATPCVYTDTISWSAPDQPLPMVRDPRVAFEQLFGAGGTPEARAARLRSSRSVLDFVLGEAKRLQREVDAEDARRIDRYLANVREIERRIQQVVARNTSGEERELPGAPAGVPDSFDEHVKLMFDLQALAFEADMTRVFLLQEGPGCFEPGVSREWCGQGLPPRLPITGHSSERGRSSPESTSTMSAWVPYFPRAIAADPRGRRKPSGQDDGDLLIPLG